MRADRRMERRLRRDNSSLLSHHKEGGPAKGAASAVGIVAMKAGRKRKLDDGGKERRQQRRRADEEDEEMEEEDVEEEEEEEEEEEDDDDDGRKKKVQGENGNGDKDGRSQSKGNWPRRIRALDPDVVNRIAAGEIIVAPVNAVKELIENCVDAGSTVVDIVAKDGGLKLLHVTDNGCGIQMDDLPILCKRHTTSKIAAFEDLSSINTYGFRGEALASISLVAHVTVTSRTKNSPLAYRAHYQGDELVAPKPGQSSSLEAVAGLPGTKIVVEDLFYNNPIRLAAFRSGNDEYNKIIDMVGRYGIHCQGVAFTVRKFQDASHTLVIRSQDDTTARIRQIYGGSVADALVEFTHVNDECKVRVRLLATNANYHSKKLTMLLFINNRSVECPPLKKALDREYTRFLPQGGRPFIYLDVQIEPDRVDVNVHPTKREVHFLNEDDIIADICVALEQKLRSLDTARSLPARQPTLLGAATLGRATALDDDDDDETVVVKLGFTGKKPRRNPPPNSLVRVDNSQPKITTMLPRSMTAPDPNARARGEPTFKAHEKNCSYNSDQASRDKVLARAPLDVPVIVRLWEEIREEEDPTLARIFSQLTFIGIVDEERRIAVVQSQARMYLFDYAQVCLELFYQLGLSCFGRFDLLHFESPVDIQVMIGRHLQDAPSESDEDERFTPDRVTAWYIKNKDKLLDYFGITVTDDGKLCTVPMLFMTYTPSLARLPVFLFNFALCGRDAKGAEEQGEFVKQAIVHIAYLWLPERLARCHDDDDDDDGGPDASSSGNRTSGLAGELADRRIHVKKAVEHLFFPLCKRLVATKQLRRSGMVEAGDLKRAYHEFERS